MKLAAVTPSASLRSLPPLSGGLLAVYRGLWILLALGSATVLGLLAVTPAMEPAILTLRLVKGGILLAVSWILLRRRTNDAVAALLSLTMLLWTITSSYDLATGDLPTPVVIADQLRFLLFAIALLLFPAGAWSPGWTRPVAGISVGVFLLGVAETLGLAPTRLFLSLAILCVLAALGALLARFRSAGSVERQQVRWAALGLVAGISLILAARAGAGLRTLRDVPMLDALMVEGLLQFGIVLIAVGFLVSLLRYRLYDAEFVISRSATYAALTLSLVATFAGTEALIEMFGQRYFGSGLGDVSAAMAAALAAVLLAPLHNRITDWAERHFQRELAVLKEQLPELLAELGGISSSARVGQAALGRIEVALNSMRAAMVVDGRVVAASGTTIRTAERWLQAWTPSNPAHAFDTERNSDFSLRIPLHCPFGSLRGWLLLGPRPDESPFSNDDLDALAAILPALKRALFAARERELEREQDLVEQQSLLEAVQNLQVRLAALEGAQARN